MPEPILLNYTLLFDDAEIGMLAVAETLFDGLSFASGETVHEDDVQDMQYLRTFARTGQTLWVGHRGINLTRLIVAFPVLTDRQVENEEAHQLLGAQLKEDEFHPLIIALQVRGQELTIPAYGPTQGRHPFRGAPCGGFIDIQGVLVNTDAVREILVVDAQAESWGKVRKTWSDRASTNKPSTSE